MSKEHEEFELGRNLTHLFKSDSRKETSAISVRLSGKEIKRLEDIGRESGETRNKAAKQTASNGGYSCNCSANKGQQSQKGGATEADRARSARDATVALSICSLDDNSGNRGAFSFFGKF